MDNELNPSENKEKTSLSEDQQYQNALIEKWARSSSLRRTLLKGIPLLLIIIGIPITVNLAMQRQSINSKADTQATLPKTVTVSSIAELLTALADNNNTEIVVKNGTYVIPNAASSVGQTSGLWIDQRFAARTNPVIVRAETVGGVTFSGGGSADWSALDFRDGVHDMTWQGFHFANGDPTQTGVIVFGQNGSVVPVAPHHITLLDITIDETVTSANPVGVSGDHAVYFSSAQTPMHDIDIERLTVNATTSGLDSALHFYTQPALGPGPQNVTVKDLVVNGTDQAIIFWDASLKNILIDGATITGAKNFAVRYELGGSVTLQNTKSTKSTNAGFYSSTGTNPPGITFINDNFDGKLYGPQQTVTPANQPTLTSSPTPTPKPTFTPTPTLKPTSTPTPSPKPTLTPTPTLKPTSTPTPTVSNLPTATPTITLAPTVTPTPTLSNGQQKKCVKFFFFKFCF